MGAHHHHHHHHRHDHPHETTTLRAFVLTAAFMVVEALGGWVSGSLALIADAAHMLTDSMALALAWAGFRFGRMAADPKRTYGYQRLEVLAALVNGAAVMVLAAWIVWEAVERLGAPSPVLGLPMLLVAAVGLAVNVLVLRTLHAGHDHGEAENLNLEAASLHVLGDLIGSAAAVIAAVVIMTTGWTPIDPLLSLGVAALILVNGWRLMRSAAHILLEGTPEDFDAAAVCRALQALPGVADVHHIHAWSLTSGKTLVTLHARLSAEADPETALAAIKAELLRRFGLGHSVVQTETAAACPDADDPCA